MYVCMYVCHGCLLRCDNQHEVLLTLHAQQKMLERLQVQSPIALETADGEHGGFNQEIEAPSS